MLVLKILFAIMICCPLCYLMINLLKAIVRDANRKS